MNRVEQMKQIQHEALELFTKKNIDYRIKKYHTDHFPPHRLGGRVVYAVVCLGE
jgi:hypothetical protein